MPSDVFSLAKRMERAARNDTGFMVTAEEMHVMLGAGVYDTISALKIKELQARCGVTSPIMPPSSEPTLPSNCEAKPRPLTGPAARAFIAALSASA